MDDRLCAVQRARRGLGIAHVAADEAEVLVREHGQQGLPAERQIVQHGHLVPGAEEFEAEHRTEVPGSARHKKPHDFKTHIFTKSISPILIHRPKLFGQCHSRHRRRCIEGRRSHPPGGNAGARDNGNGARAPLMCAARSLRPPAWARRPGRDRTAPMPHARDSADEASEAVGAVAGRWTACDPSRPTPRLRSRRVGRRARTRPRWPSVLFGASAAASPVYVAHIGRHRRRLCGGHRRDAPRPPAHTASDVWAWAVIEVASARVRVAARAAAGHAGRKPSDGGAIGVV